MREYCMFERLGGRWERIQSIPFASNSLKEVRECLERIRPGRKHELKIYFREVSDWKPLGGIEAADEDEDGILVNANNTDNNNDNDKEDEDEE